jgi:hypothetical protein
VQKKFSPLWLEFGVVCDSKLDMDNNNSRKLACAPVFAFFRASSEACPERSSSADRFAFPAPESAVVDAADVDATGTSVFIAASVAVVSFPAAVAD